jgi:uncharacterized protein YukE
VSIAGRADPMRCRCEFHPCNSVRSFNHGRPESSRCGALWITGPSSTAPRISGAGVVGPADSRTMSNLFDPADLDAVADRINGHAAATRARALRLGMAVAAAEWRGAAAAAFGAEAQLTISAQRGAAGGLDDAADALRRHARRACVLYDDLKGLGLDGLQTLTDTVARPDRLVSDGRRLLSDGADLVGDTLHLVGL